MVQTGVHFEEVTEHLDTVTGNDVEASLLVIEANDALKRLAEHMKSEPTRYSYQRGDHVKLLDALCDQNVTGVGIAYMKGFDMNAAMTEVNASNFSKFVNGEAIFNEQGKIAKGPEFFRPDLSQFVKA